MCSLCLYLFLECWPLVCVQLFGVIALVTCIHFLEAYLLNPAIYAAHLKLHPLLVLSVLVVAEHSLGVWGLLLAGELFTCLGYHTVQQLRCEARERRSPPVPPRLPN